MKKIILILCLMLAPVLITSCGEERETLENTIIVGLDDTFVPMGFKDSNGEIVGFDVDLAKAVGENIGYNVEFQPIDWSMKEMELDSGNIDVIWNGYSITEERKGQVDFTKEYLKNRQVIITLKDSNIKDKGDLKGKTVAVQAESSSQEAVEKDKDMIKTFKKGELILFESNNDAFMDLESHRSDAIVADEIMARYYISKIGKEKFKVLDDDFGKELYSVGLRKGDDILKDKINNALLELKEHGTIKEISNKWFKEDITNIE